jgi:Ca-activated chloride channel homolog
MQPRLAMFHDPRVDPEQRTLHSIISLTARETETRTRGPLALALAVDRSYSMNRNMSELRRLVMCVLRCCSADTVVSVLGFSDEATVLAKAGRCSPEFIRQTQRAVNELTATGGTRLSRAVRASLDQLRPFEDHGKRLLLLTDGRNSESRAELERAAESCRRAKVPVSAWGLGLDWDEEDLLLLSRATGGEAQFVVHPQELAAAFTGALEEQHAQRLTDLELRFPALHGRVRNLVQVYPEIRPLPVEDGCFLGDLVLGKPRVFRLEMKLEEIGALKVELHFSQAGKRMVAEFGDDLGLREEAGAAAVHPYVTHYLKQEEACRLAEEGRKAWATGDQRRARELLTRAQETTSALGNARTTQILTELLAEKPDSGASAIRTQKTVALQLYRTVLMGGELPEPSE